MIFLRGNGMLAKEKNSRELNETGLFSNKDLVKIILPLMLQQILSVLVGAIDTMMVSYAGESAVSGVSLVNSLDTVLVIFFTAMIGGGSIVVSQALGRKNYAEVNESAKQLIYIATAIATVLTVIVITFRKPLLSLLFGGAEPDVMANAQDYFFFVALSFPLLAIESGISSIFRASGNTAISLAVSIILNVVNIIGNAVLIMGFDMGAKGAAIATLIARFTGGVILLVLILNKKRSIHIENIFRYKPDFKTIRKILYIGVPNGTENVMFQFGRLLTQALISGMGTAVIAANSVALTLANFQYTIGTACSTAMIAVVGRCIGAGETGQAKRYSRILLGLNYVSLWLLIVVMTSLIEPIISLYSLSAEASELGKQLFVYHSICAALIWPIGFMLPSSFRAAGDVHFSLVVSMISMWIFRVAGGYVFALESVSVFGLFSFPGLGMGAMGVWIAMTVDWVFRAAFFLWRYLSGRWLQVKKL